MNNQKAGDRKFYFMVAATVLFNMPEADDQVSVNTATLNAMLTHDKDVFPARMLGKAQQAVQMQLFKKLGEESTKANVLDVTILNVMNLGYMTDAEFQAVPEGTQQTEKKPGKLKVVGGTAPVTH
ncbi:hypothetical protein SB861_37645 [Paraburkholderia sp. SIMBA_049]